MINPSQLAEYIIVPALKEMGLYSADALMLLLGTAAQESHMGTYLKQIKGPACGPYCMEPATFHDTFNNFLIYHDELLKRFNLVINHDRPLCPEDMIHDLKLATVMCRLHYYRVPYPIPSGDDIEGIAQYWKAYYNTEKGKGTVEQFMENFKRVTLN